MLQHRYTMETSKYVTGDDVFSVRRLLLNTLKDDVIVRQQLMDVWVTGAIDIDEADKIQEWILSGFRTDEPTIVKRK